MTDTVHCYFEDLTVYPGQDVLIPIWEKTWQDHGWKTRILGLEDAKKHPMHDKFMEHVNLIPSSNHHDYENSCYRRHLAMAMLENGGLMTDYDVINMTFTPEQMPPLNDHLETLDEDGVICAAFGAKPAWEEWVEQLSNHVDQTGAAYVSDMTIFWTRKPVIHGQCVGIFNEDWEKAPLVHFANYHCIRDRPGIPRLTLMKQFLETGKA